MSRLFRQEQAHLNPTWRRIVTVEDPVEYTVPGAQEVQGQEEIGVSCAEILRGALRRDPKSIPLGETAEIAVRAAQVQRRVLSPLHTNATARALNRLVGSAVPEFLVRDVLRGVLGQEPILTPCPGCGGAGVGKRELRVEMLDFWDQGVRVTVLVTRVICSPSRRPGGWFGARAARGAADRSVVLRGPRLACNLRSTDQIPELPRANSVCKAVVFGAALRTQVQLRGKPCCFWSPVQRARSDPRLSQRLRRRRAGRTCASGRCATTAHCRPPKRSR